MTREEREALARLAGEWAELADHARWSCSSETAACFARDVMPRLPAILAHVERLEAVAGAAREAARDLRSFAGTMHPDCNPAECSFAGRRVRLEAIADALARLDLGKDGG